MIAGIEDFVDFFPLKGLLVVLWVFVLVCSLLNLGLPRYKTRVLLLVYVPNLSHCLFFKNVIG